MTAWTETPALHGSLRVFSGETFGGTVDVGGGATSWALAAGTYADFVALATGIDTALTTAVGGTWTVSLVGSGASGFTIALGGGGTFTLTVHSQLQTFCGLAASYGPGVTSASSTSDPPFVYVPAYPIHLGDCWYEYIRAETIHHTAASVATLRGTVTHYSGRVIVDDAAQWRTFCAYARKGIPFRLYHNYPTDTGAWSLSNRDGRLDLVLADPSTSEAWLTDPATVILDGQLECLVV